MLESPADLTSVKSRVCVSTAVGHLARGLLSGQLTAQLRAACLHAVHLLSQPCHAGVRILQGRRLGSRHGRHAAGTRRRLHDALHAHRASHTRAVAVQVSILYAESSYLLSMRQMRSLWYLMAHWLIAFQKAGHADLGQRRVLLVQSRQRRVEPCQQCLFGGEPASAAMRFITPGTQLVTVASKLTTDDAET